MAENSYSNPFDEGNDIIANPCIIVIFGATGDLTARRLIPALYNLAKEGRLPSHFACVGFARRPKNDQIFRDEMKKAVSEFSRTKPIDNQVWEKFSERLFYHMSNFDDDAGYSSLKERLNELDIQFGTKQNRLYYFSVAPSYFTNIASHLSKQGLLQDPLKTRIVVEKPFGHDLQSAQSLQHSLTQYCKEEQLFRIDHWLGKETVQNLFTLRFANSLFESLWNKDHISRVEISVAEELGVGTRGNFFEEVGILRDIIQNHAIQLLSLIAMEPPTSLEANAIRDEKVKVVQALRPIPLTKISNYAVRGQYGPGFIQGKEVVGYRGEGNVSPNSKVETYAALKLYVDTPRFFNVPFYIRAGKRLAKRSTEIAIVFKNPLPLYSQNGHTLPPNVLAIKIQPDEGISLKINSKLPGYANIVPMTMDLRYSSYFNTSSPDAYERLLCDAMQGDATLFAREDEVMAAWKFCTPILDYWKQNEPSNFPNYAAGSWGPLEADLLMNSPDQWRLL